jgi:DNA-binding SARP family transcriptional activator
VLVVVRILGPLEVICDGRHVPIRGGKERALLVRLAILLRQFWAEPDCGAG